MQRAATACLALVLSTCAGANAAAAEETSSRWRLHQSIMTLVSNVLSTCAGANAAAAEETSSRWRLHQSIMTLVSNADKRSFSYESPQPELAQVGVGQGVLFFDGRIEGRKLRGTARAF